MPVNSVASIRPGAVSSFSPGSGQRNAPPSHQYGAGIRQNIQQQQADQSQDMQGLPPEVVRQIESAFLQQQKMIEKQSKQIEHLSGRNEKIVKAITGEDKKEHTEKWIDGILQHALEQKAQGIEMPVTLEIAEQLQGMMDEREKTRTLIQKMSQQIQALTREINDPGAQQDRLIFSHFDNLVDQTLSQMYGRQVPKHVRNSLIQSLSQNLKYVRAKSPKGWNILRSNSEKRKLMVQKLALTLIPTSARQMMAKRYEQSIPLNANTINKAMLQMKKYKRIAKTNPQLYNRFVTQVRRVVLGFESMQRGRAR